MGKKINPVRANRYLTLRYVRVRFGKESLELVPNNDAWINSDKVRDCIAKGMDISKLGLYIAYCVESGTFKIRDFGKDSLKYIPLMRLKHIKQVALLPCSETRRFLIKELGYWIEQS